MDPFAPEGEACLTSPCVQCPEPLCTPSSQESRRHFLYDWILLSQPQDQITITGYEKNTEAARDAILKIVGELEQMVSEDVALDHRVHARIIGARGKAIRKIMDEFKVRVQLHREGHAGRSADSTSFLPCRAPSFHVAQ